MTTSQKETDEHIHRPDHTAEWSSELSQFKGLNVWTYDHLNSCSFCSLTGMHDMMTQEEDRRQES